MQQQLQKQSGLTRFVGQKNPEANRAHNAGTKSQEELARRQRSAANARVGIPGSGFNNGHAIADPRFAQQQLDRDAAAMPPPAVPDARDQQPNIYRNGKTLFDSSSINDSDLRTETDVDRNEAAQIEQMPNALPDDPSGHATWGEASSQRFSDEGSESSGDFEEVEEDQVFPVHPEDMQPGDRVVVRNGDDGQDTITSTEYGGADSDFSKRFQHMNDQQLGIGAQRAQVHGMFDDTNASGIETTAEVSDFNGIPMASHPQQQSSAQVQANPNNYMQPSRETVTTYRGQQSTALPVRGGGKLVNSVPAVHGTRRSTEKEHAEVKRQQSTRGTDPRTNPAHEYMTDNLQLARGGQTQLNQETRAQAGTYPTNGHSAKGNDLHGTQDRNRKTASSKKRSRANSAANTHPRETVNAPVVTPSELAPPPVQTPQPKVPRLDYERDDLFKMSYADLHNQSFDDNPRPYELRLPKNIAKADLKDRLQHVQSLPDTTHKAEFFASLPISEWEKAGEWFLGRFGATMNRMVEARKTKRELAAKFEEEIYKRDQAIAKRFEKVDVELRSMRSDGQKLLRTPSKDRG